MRTGRVVAAALLGAALAAGGAGPAAAAGPYSIWTSTQGPAAGEYYLDPSPLEIGVRFTADADGQVSGIRFYKVAGNNGTHLGHLWTNTGTLLASVTFTGESASGWQTALFASSVAIRAGTTYVASFHSTSGYAATRSYFAVAHDNPPLHAPASATGALNGLYTYSANTIFPTQSTQQSNYWVDVVFDVAGSTAPTPNPVPTVASLSPSSATAGGGGFTLTVAGSGFVSGSNVLWNGSGRATTFVSPSTLRAAIPSSDLVSTGTASVTVFSPAPGGGISNAATFTINAPAGNPVPSLSSLSPSSATAGGAAFTLSAAGGGFVNGAVVRWNGSDRPTTFVSSTRLTASIPAGDLSSPGTATVTAFNPGPGGGTSNGLSFSVNAAAPPPSSTTTYTLWTTQGPASNEFYLDPNPLSLGVRFFSDVPGQVTGIRFYKVSGNTGPHSAQLYTSTGALLGTASFASETASGWQTATFSSPIAIASNTVYVAAYFSPTGYAATRNYFTSAFDAPPLHAPANSAAALNGLYVYGSSPAFPRNSYQATNYWVDVAFAQSVSTSPAPPPPAPAKTIVSLTFDDGTAGHVIARQILDARGLKGTFYINSGRIGATGYMTLDDIRGIGAAGHEIAGHTIHHYDLTTLSSSDAQHEICDDRSALMSLGFRPTAFAYPFGAYNASVESIVRGCGYTDGRALGGIACTNCPLAETVPPRDPYAIISPDSIKSTTTLAQIEKYVTDAENAGGGWVPLVFHVICNVNCDTYSISTTTLSAFADWVSARASLGTVVRTMGDVMGSPATPPGPFLSALSPSQATAGGPSFTLTASGGGFASGSVIRWNGSARTTAFVSASTLTATIAAADIASAGTSTVTVLNPDGTATAGLAFTVNASTASACLTSAGAWQNRPFPSQTGSFEAGFDATPGASGMDGVAGLSSGPASGFPAVASIVRFSTSGFIDARNGGVYAADAAIPYSAGTSYHVRLAVNMSARTYSAYVRAGAGAEQALATNYAFRTEQASVGALNNLGIFADIGSETVCSLAISTAAAAPAPFITALSPSSTTAGGGDFTLTVDGSGFATDSRVRWNGNGKTTTFVSPTRLTALVLAADIQFPGTVSVVVENPGPSTTTSNTATFTVNPSSASGNWAVTGAMTTTRFWHTLTALQDGRALAAGGTLRTGDISGFTFTPLASAELYDPATETFSSAASMSAARTRHAAVRLSDGRVLVAGGDGLASAELFDPATGAWSVTGAMAAARAAFAAVRLADGRVLVAGGANGSTLLAGAEIYDPASGTWASAGAMAQARSGHTASLLQDGRVLIAGGSVPAGGNPNVAEIYDPVARTWSAAGSLAVARVQHSATVLSNGFVLVAGGNTSSGATATAELFNPGAGTWSATGSMSSARQSQSAVLLSDGRVLEAAGATNTAELYDPAAGTWSPAGSLATIRQDQAAARLANGWVLISGGRGGSGGPLASADVNKSFPASSAPFFDGFNQPDGLITNQNTASPRSANWTVVSGSLFASGGQGWTGVPDNVVPNATSSNGTGSAIFRALTTPTGLGSDVTVKVTVAGFVSAQPIGNWDGAHIYLRYQDPGNYYQLSVYRRDGRAAIKKRLNGTESTFNTPLYNAAPVGTQQTARAVATNNSNGSVTLQLYVNGTLVASAVDTASPLTATGKAGMAGENTNFTFDDFTIAASSGGIGVARVSSPQAFAPSSRTLAAAYGGQVQQIDATGVAIPEGALPADAQVTVARSTGASDAGVQARRRLEQGLQPASDEIAISPPDARLKLPAAVIIGYDPAKLAASGIKEGDLKVYRWDAAGGDWVGLASTVDPAGKTVTALSDRLGLYQLMAPGTGVAAADASFGWKAQYVFPNPVRGARSATFRVQPGAADSVELRVYDDAGRKVYSSSEFRNRGPFDDGNGLGPQFTYEHVWDISGIGSGVYSYIVVARKAGQSEIRESGKVGVVK